MKSTITYRIEFESGEDREIVLSLDEITSRLGAFCDPNRDPQNFAEAWYFKHGNDAHFYDQQDLNDTWDEVLKFAQSQI